MIRFHKDGMVDRVSYRLSTRGKKINEYTFKYNLISGWQGLLKDKEGNGIELDKTVEETTYLRALKNFQDSFSRGTTAKILNEIELAQEEYDRIRK